MEIVRKENREEIQSLREAYLDSLLEPTELYLEMLMKNAISYLIKMDGKEAGYAIAGEDNVLYEFYVVPDYIPKAGEIFSNVLKDLSIKKAFCQSFDTLFHSMCVSNSRGESIIGHQFRELSESEGKRSDLKLNERIADLKDLDTIRRYREEIFDDSEVEDIPFYINKGSIKIFEEENGEFAGYGMLNRTLPSRNWFDVGMFVHPDKRRRSYGTHIILRMVEMARSNGWRPIAGCAEYNKASKRTLEKAGFISRYVLMEFEF